MLNRRDFNKWAIIAPSFSFLKFNKKDVYQVTFTVTHGWPVKAQLAQFPSIDCSIKIDYNDGSVEFFDCVNCVQGVEYHGYKLKVTHDQSHIEILYNDNKFLRGLISDTKTLKSSFKRGLFK